MGIVRGLQQRLVRVRHKASRAWLGLGLWDPNQAREAKLNPWDPNRNSLTLILKLNPCFGIGVRVRVRHRVRRLCLAA